jgi:hypothetical protein
LFDRKYYKDLLFKKGLVDWEALVYLPPIIFGFVGISFRRQFQTVCILAKSLTNGFGDCVSSKSHPSPTFVGNILVRVK